MVEDSNPFKDSDTEGTSGKSGLRSVLETPKASNLPDLIKGSKVTKLSMVI